MSLELIHGLPTPPMERKMSGRKSSPKSSKQILRGARRQQSVKSQDPNSGPPEGKHKRVWKACERCRMKKTKCDGESPCKRCKDDGLVCTAGVRKKTEYKQLPQGYAEVLENTQYALIATVQKLYNMIRNEEEWTLGDPEINDRGQPVIHDIARRLGCIRQSTDLPVAFPEDAVQFAALQAQMEASIAEDEHGDTSQKQSTKSGWSSQSRTDRESSSESDHSTNSADYIQMLWNQQQLQEQEQLLEQGQFASQFAAPQSQPPMFGDQQFFSADFTPEAQSLDAMELAFASRASVPSLYTEMSPVSQTQSPQFRGDSPFSQWRPGADEFLGNPSMLDMTASYMQNHNQLQGQGNASFYEAPRSAPLTRGSRQADGGYISGQTSPMPGSTSSAMLGNMDILQSQLGNFMAGEGTIQPGMLQSSRSFDAGEQLGDQMFMDYETQQQQQPQQRKSDKRRR